MVGLSLALRSEAAAHNVGVLAVCPAAVETRSWTRASSPVSTVAVLPNGPAQQGLYDPDRLAGHPARDPDATRRSWWRRGRPMPAGCWPGTHRVMNRMAIRFVDNNVRPRNPKGSHDDAHLSAHRHHRRRHQRPDRRQDAHDYGVPYTTFELSDRIGGNWASEKPHRPGSAYRSPHTTPPNIAWRSGDSFLPFRTSSWPFPHHPDIKRHLDDHADASDLLTTSSSATASYTPAGPARVGRSRIRPARCASSTLVVGNGHHWDARMPTSPARSPAR